jgi:phosphoglucomutase
MNHKETYDEWTARATDPAIKSELLAMRGDDTKIRDAFFRELSFGTAGLRGVIAAGTNCLNIYTIRRATQGLLKYIKSIRPNGASVAICYDNRINSELFARTTAEVLAGGGVTVNLSKTLAPVPFLSFATRETGATVGVMITASHNPKQYNGYKVFGADGCQLTDDGAAAVTRYIETEKYFDAPAQTFVSLLKSGKIKYLPDTLTEKYLERVTTERIGEKIGADFSVAYTALHGTGYQIVPKVLKKIGVKNIFSPAAQQIPDGEFPTCKSPNPEKPAALELVIETARANGADIAIATDPDADRVGVAVRTANGEYKLLTGNEVGVLLCDYILSSGKIKRPIIIKTIVTTLLGEKVAKGYGAEVINVLTGFKYIGEKIGELENRGEASRFALGFEESYGYLKGTYVRDKDGVVTCMLICEMAAHHKKAGATLVDAITAIYEKFGFVEHKLVSFEFAGATGADKKDKFLTHIRKNPPTAIGNIAVKAITDYQTQTAQKLPRADVLQYDLENGNQVIVRPSGTEPLVKIYLTGTTTTPENATFFASAEKEFRGMLA